MAPGFFASEMTAELGDDPEAFPPFLLERTPLARGGRTGELDEAVLFLLGPGSSFVTGHVAQRRRRARPLSQSRPRRRRPAATSGATTRCASSKPEPSMAPPAARAATPWQTTASLK